MKGIFIRVGLVLLMAPALSIAQSQQTQTQKDLQKTAASLKALGNLFKKKPAPAQPGQAKPTGTTTTANPILTGTDGTMPPPNAPIFATQGGGVLFAGLQSSIVLINGVLYGWGNNFYGQSGNGKTDANYLPVQITTDNDWKSLSTGGYYNVAIKTDGSMWSWGWGNTGELGLGNIYKVEYPTRIGHDTTWASVSAADGHVAAIKTDGSLWVWGNKIDARLGVGPTLNSKSVVPMLLNKDKDWAKVAAGEDFTLALKKDGSLWAWGRNSNGALGVRTVYETQQVPIRVGHDNDWVKIYSGLRGNGSFAIKADGSLWAWGYNRSNQLGIGDVKESYTPLQVTVDKDWAAIANLSIYTIGIKTDGSMWEWGTNVKGIQRINVKGRWVAAGVSFGFAIAMRNDGTIWTRGHNSDGALGYIRNGDFYTTDFVQVKVFPDPVITTKPKAVLSTVLNEDASLLFKQVHSKLTILDKNKITTLLGFQLSADKKQFVLNKDGADYPFDVQVYPTDLNKDGSEEVFMVYGNSYTSGAAGSSVVLFVKDVYGDWHSHLDITGVAPQALATTYQGYPDLMVGGPGANFPVFRWSGSRYDMVKQVRDADLPHIKRIDIAEVSKRYLASINGAH